MKFDFLRLQHRLAQSIKFLKHTWIRGDNLLDAILNTFDKVTAHFKKNFAFGTLTFSVVSAVIIIISFIMIFVSISGAVSNIHSVLKDPFLRTIAVVLFGGAVIVSFLRILEGKNERLRKRLLLCVLPYIYFSAKQLYPHFIENKIVNDTDKIQSVSVFSMPNVQMETALPGGRAFSSSSIAQPGDAVSFQVFLQNEGGRTGEAPQIECLLDEGLHYIEGSSYVRTKRENRDHEAMVREKHINRNSGQGKQKIVWAFSDMRNSPTEALYLMFQARVIESLPTPRTLYAEAEASFGNSDVRASKKVPVVVSDGLNKPVVLTLEVLNDSIGLGKSHYFESVFANHQDVLKFRIQAINRTKKPLKKFPIEIVLPKELTIDEKYTLYNSEHPSGKVISNTESKNVFVLPNFFAGTPGTQTVCFNAKVGYKSEERVTKVATARVKENERLNAVSSVEIHLSTIKGIHLKWKIKKTNQKLIGDKVTYVEPGDLLNCSLLIQNTAFYGGDKPKLHISLPLQIKRIGNVSIDGQEMDDSVSNAFFEKGLAITNLESGLTQELTFLVKVLPPDLPVDSTVTLSSNLTTKDGIHASEPVRFTIRSTADDF